MGVLQPTLLHADEAERIYAGVYLHDVSRFNQKDGIFDADFELWAKWRGEFDPENITLANANEDVEWEVIGEEADGEWHSKRWRVRGTMRGEFPVQQFPFDEQTLAIELELPERFGQLAPDLAGSGMRQHFSVTGWLYQPEFFPRSEVEVYSSDLGMIEGEGMPTTVNRVSFEVTLSRPLVTAATKLFLPLLVILLVAFVALFIHPKELGVRASVGVTALLACYAFHFAVARSMPTVSYITLAETLFLVSYGLCAGLLCVSIAAKTLHDNGHENVHQRLDRIVLFAFPLVLVGTGFVVVPSETKVEEPVLPAEQPRFASSRDTLKVGTTTLTRPSGGLISRATHWSTTRNPPGEDAYPVLVREAPSITNNSLGFMANGQLQVTWRLLPELKWSDGEPFTSDDLVFSMKVSPDPRIIDVDVLNSTDVVVTYRKRVAAAMEGIRVYPRHALKEAYEKGGYDEVRAYRDANIVPTAGAYDIKEFVKNDHVYLEANPHFASEPPSISRIEVYRYGSEAELIAAFEAGQIDMTMPNAVTPEAALAYAKKRPEAVDISPSDLLLFLHPDLSNPLLAQFEVRKALLMALDRDRLREEVFGEIADSAPIAHIPVPGELPDGTQQTRFAPVVAKMELERLGAAGKSIELFHGPTRFDRQVVAHVVRDAKAAGLTLVPVEVEDASRAYRDPRHGGLLLITRTGLREDPPEKWWNVPRKAGKYDRTVRHDAMTDEIAVLMEREERALYPERREQIRDMLYAEFSKAVPLLPLCFLADRTIVDPELQGWKVGSGKTFGRTVERWYFSSGDEEDTGEDANLSWYSEEDESTDTLP